MRDLYDFIFSLPPRSFTLTAILIGFLLIDDLDGTQQNALANFILIIGQVLETNSGQKQLLEKLKSSQQDKELREEVEKLKKMIKMQQK